MIDAVNTTATGSAFAANTANFDSAVNRASAWQTNASAAQNAFASDVSFPMGDDGISVDDSGDSIDENASPFGDEGDDTSTSQLQNEIADLKGQIDQLTQATTLLLQGASRQPAAPKGNAGASKNPLATLLSNTLLGGSAAAAFGAMAGGKAAGPIFAPIGGIIGATIGGLGGSLFGAAETVAAGPDNSQQWVQDNGAALFQGMGIGTSGGVL